MAFSFYIAMTNVINKMAQLLFETHILFFFFLVYSDIENFNDKCFSIKSNWGIHLFFLDIRNFTKRFLGYRPHKFTIEILFANIMYEEIQIICYY